MDEKKEKLLNKNNSYLYNNDINKNYVKIIPDFNDEEESFNNINISNELIENNNYKKNNINESKNITFIFNNTNNISNSIIINKNDLFKNNENFINNETMNNLNIIKDNSKLCVFVSSNKNSKIKTFKDKEFAFVEDDNLTTFFHNNNSYSKINNIQKIENENKDIIKFLLVKNVYDNNNNLIKGFNENDIDLNVSKEQFSVFINNINKFVNAEKFKKIDKNFQKKIKINIFFLILVSLIILSMLILIFVLVFILKKENFIFFLSFVIIILIVALIILIRLILFFKNRYFLLMKKKFIFMEQKKDELEKFVFKWNKTFFNEKDINVEIPILFDYILFNMNFSKYEVYINPFNNPLLSKSDQMNINLNYLK